MLSYSFVGQTSDTTINGLKSVVGRASVLSASLEKNLFPSFPGF